MLIFNHLHTRTCLFVFALLLGFAPLVFGKEGQALLTNSDCQKCHPQVKKTIEMHGGAHRDKVQCGDCHAEHPPWGENVLPDCHQCHSGTAHFALEACLQCHANPHAPLDLVFSSDMTDPCLTCHSVKGVEFKMYISKHAEVPCSRCHYKHGYIPVCTDCHSPHLDSQRNEDCVGCHSGHRPLDINYIITTKSSICAVCHAGFVERLKRHKTRHSKMTCAFCHRTIHRIIPLCRTCHLEPHSKSMHRKWPDCLGCHRDPHNLVI